MSIPERRTLVCAAAALVLMAVAPSARAAVRSTYKLAPYSILAVEKFTVDRNAATEELPKGLETILQGRAIEELRKKGLFQGVEDASALVIPDSSAVAAPPAAPAPDSAVIAPPAAPRSDSVSAPASGVAATRETSAAPAPSIAPSGTPPAASGNRRLLLGCTIRTYDKGSRAARYFGGFGAGQTKITARFTLRDAQTGAEVLTFDEQGTYKGMFSTFGGSQDQAYMGALNGLLKAMMQELARNR